VSASFDLIVFASPRDGDRVEEALWRVPGRFSPAAL
jgi:hypothetical protein